MILWPQLSFGEQPAIYDFSTPDLFKILLDDPETRFIHLIELEPYDDSLPLAVTGIPPMGTLSFGEFDLVTGGGINRIFLSDMGFTTTPTDTRPNQHFKALVNNPLQVETSILGGTEFGNGSTTFGSIIIENGDKEMDAAASYEWSGRKVTVKAGAKGLAYSDFATVFSGAIEDYEDDDERINLTIRDNRIRLDQPLFAGTYAGTGGLEGGDDIAGQSKPLCFGKVLNIEPRLVDPVTLIYQIHDSSVLSIGKVRDSGVELTYAGDVPSITAATPAAGTYVTQLSGGYLRLGSTPAGRITANAEGDNGAGYVSTAGEIIKRLAKTRLAVSPFDSSEIDDGAFARIDAAVSGPVGFYSAEAITASEIIDGLLLPIAAYWNFDRLGILTGGVLETPSIPSLTLDTTNIDEEGPQRIASIPPAWRIQVGYAPLGVVQGEDELAGATTDEDRAFLTSGYRFATLEDQSIRTRDTRAQERTFLTRLTEKADAEALLSRLGMLFMEPRNLYRAPLHNMIYRASVGATATMIYPRRGLEGGIEFLVAGVSEDAETGLTTLTLWG